MMFRVEYLNSIIRVFSMHEYLHSGRKLNLKPFYNIQIILDIND